MNIEWTSQGFRSAYGHDVISLLPAATGPNPMADLVEANGDVVVVGRGYVTDVLGSQLFEFSQRYEESELNCRYKWSESCVGCDVVLSHPLHPLVIQDQQTGCWREWCSPDWNSPIYGSASFGGRLFVLLEDALVWSDLDAPCSFSIDKHTGSGFQSLNLAKFGKPLGLYATASALYTFTDRGIMVTTLDGVLSYTAEGVAIFGALAFKHTAVSTELLACNPCAIRSDSTSVFWRAQAGLYTFGERGPTDVSPELSAWLRDNSCAAEAELYIDEARNILHILVKEGEFITYDSALQKWGAHDVPLSALHSQKGQKCAYFLMGHYFVGRFNGKTRPTARALTSSLRAPIVNIFDVNIREIEVHEIEVHGAEDGGDYECRLKSGTSPKAVGDLPLRLAREADCLKVFATRSKALYHAAELVAFDEDGGFHVSGLTLNGRFAGVNRK